MGRDKALLPFRDSLLIDQIARKMVPVFHEVIIVSTGTRAYSVQGTRLALDIFPQAGPLGGLHAGLTAAENPLAFVTACDMPGFVPALADLLIASMKDCDAAVPIYRNRPEPLSAVYSREILPTLENFLHGKRLKMRDFLNAIKINYVNEREIEKITAPAEAFLNINAPGDFPSRESQG